MPLTCGCITQLDTGSPRLEAAITFTSKAALQASSRRCSHYSLCVPFCLLIALLSAALPLCARALVCVYVCVLVDVTAWPCCLRRIAADVSPPPPPPSTCQNWANSNPQPTTPEERTSVMLSKFLLLIGVLVIAFLLFM